MSIILDGTNGENFPAWTTGTRPASPIAGQTGYNTSLGQLEVYNGSAWGAASISASGLAVSSGGTGQISALTQGGVVYSASTTAMGNTGAGTSGQPLISAGTSAPAFGTVALGTANTNVSGALTVTNGGTGAATLTANNVLLGNGTSALQVVAPGTTGNVLTSNGTTWTSSAAGGGLGGQTVFTSSGTFTIPSGKTVVKVTIVGGGGGSGGSTNQNTNQGESAGGGGTAIKYLTGLTPGNTLTVTVGAGGTAGAGSTGSSCNSGGTGGTSSVASGTQTITTVSATGGIGGSGGYGNGGSTYYYLAVSGGSGSGGDYNIPGGKGIFTGLGAAIQCVGGWFAATCFGGASSLSQPNFASAVNSGYTPSSGNGAAVAGTGYGQGATGQFGTNLNRAGATGGAGVVIFEY
jgi:hypothetical protein